MKTIYVIYDNRMDEFGKINFQNNIPIVTKSKHQFYTCLQDVNNDLSYWHHQFKGQVNADGFLCYQLVNGKMKHVETLLG